MAILSAFFPLKAANFLESFASSARAHFFEIGFRIIVGTSMIFFASEMRFSQVFYIFGWIVIITSIGLLFVPWRQHRRFSNWTIPQIVQHLRLFALAAFAFGIFIFYSFSRVFYME
ncbi:MAG: hypothetical protein ABIP06_05475 [Pyrinomonadaceae bacterium]